MYTTNTTKAKDQKHEPLCLRTLLCMNASVKRTFSVSLIVLFACVVPDEQVPRERFGLRTNRSTGPHLSVKA